MNARGMHYDFKQKFNRLDSQGNRNFVVPEIDWKLNEGQELFVKMIAEPRVRKELGFEKNQRTIDDIRTIVVNQKPSEGIVPVVFDETSFIATLPTNYGYYLNSKVYATKGKCKKVLDVTIQQHDDEHEKSPFNRSSFEWKVANIRFVKEGIRIFTDKTFVVDKIVLEYIKEPRRIHNAQDWIGGTYEANGVVYTGSQDCELPRLVHGEIVDLAVLIAAGDIDLQSYQLKQNKLNLTN